MSVALAALLLALAPVTATATLDEAANALARGRPEQARLLMERALSQGATGDRTERLLAELAFARDDLGPALARYEALAMRLPGDAAVLGRAGIIALRLGQVERATRHLARATALPGADWQAWNARGVAADRAQDWASAANAYAEAAKRAPDRAEVRNNQGWSLLLQGRWEEAEPLLAAAAAAAPALPRAARNLELVRAALADRLPARRPGESGADFAARLNDAGVAAALRGEQSRAIAAFAQALEASDVWHVRAANNLAEVEGNK